MKVQITSGDLCGKHFLAQRRKGANARKDAKKTLETRQRFASLRLGARGSSVSAEATTY